MAIDATDTIDTTDAIMLYELMLILKPDVAEEEQKAEVDKIKKLITDGGGEVVKEDSWGKRVLAYPIKRFSEGVYHLLNFQSTPAKVKELEKKLNLDDEVLRFLVVKID
jgi:small subunit ribosomal protein S6